MKLLIADSGATKTDWAFLEAGKPVFLKGAGLHPAYLSEGEIRSELNRLFGSLKPGAIRFFGAGCYDGGGKEKISRALETRFGKIKISVHDDLTGAAKGLLKSQNGILCALGTGSACGRFRAGKISDRSASMGFAIGDEGSAAHIGKQILKKYFRKQFDSETISVVKERLQNPRYPEMMVKVYTAKSPGKILGEIAGTVFQDEITGGLSDLLSEAFSSFYQEQLLPLRPATDEKIVFVGSVAVNHAEHLFRVLNEYGHNNVFTGGSVIEGLAEFYGSKM